jgi:murein DD-endopeptidase MepM/ murein hydrolase activator NlpD
MKKIIVPIFLIFVLSIGGCHTMDTTTFEHPIAINLPLQGIWITPNTPGKKIPSHGIDKYGETYAYDFVGVDPNGGTDKFYSVSLISYLFKGVPLEKCYGWGLNVYAPFGGEIVQVEDDVIERNPAMLKRDINYMREITKRFELGKAEYKEVAGNYIILKQSEKVYALFAHLQMTSTCVKVGDKVKAGQLIGKVGHSGNSTAPHLHFQLMDNIDPIKSKGILCCFTDYEELKNGTWTKVTNGIPSTHRIRNMK